MTNKKIEEYIFNRYKWYVKFYISYHYMSDWEIIQLLQGILNKCFNYDFPYHNDHYQVIKNEKTIYEYNL